MRKLTENQIKRFLISKTKKRLNEISRTASARFTDVDDGRLGPWYNDFKAYKNSNMEQAKQYGWEVMTYLVDENFLGKDFDTFVGYIFPAGDQANKVDDDLDQDTIAPTNKKDGSGFNKRRYKTTKLHHQMYKSDMQQSAARLGFEVMKWLYKEEDVT